MRRRGFTLIELMIVIAIIAILAAVLVPNFMKIRRSAQLNGCMANTKNIATLLENYNSDHGGFYPSAGDKTDFNQNYIGTKLMMCPARRTYYHYTLDANDTAHFTVGCNGWQNATPTNFFSQGQIITSAALANQNTGDEFDVVTNDDTTLYPNGGAPVGNHQAPIPGQGLQTVFPVTDNQLGTGVTW